MEVRRKKEIHLPSLFPWSYGSSTVPLPCAPLIGSSVDWAGVLPARFSGALPWSKGSLTVPLPWMPEGGSAPDCWGFVGSSLLYLWPGPKMAAMADLLAEYCWVRGAPLAEALPLLVDMAAGDRVLRGLGEGRGQRASEMKIEVDVMEVSGKLRDDCAGNSDAGRCESCFAGL